MSELCLTEKLKNKVPHVKVSSAGLGALVGFQADPLAQELMRERALDLSLHRARQIVPELIFDAELILVMTTEQQKQVEHMFSSARGRVHRLGKWGGFDIPDPFKRPKVIFEQSLALIEQGVDEWTQTLWM